MPLKAKELGALEVSRLAKARSAGMHAVGGVDGLLLQVTATGATSWLLRTMIAGKRRAMGLGSYPAVPLAGAREKARAARLLIEQGNDPIESRLRARRDATAARANLKTFEQCTTAMLAAKEVEWRNAKHRAQWSSTLSTYANPVLGTMAVSDIELAHVMRVLEPIWLIKTETASRLRGRIEKVLDWATVHGYRQGLNPARWKGNLDAVLSQPSKVAKQEHHKALPIDETPQFMERLQSIGGMGARALEFAILTAARSGEVRGARWNELDLAAKTWTIPEERMKAKREHTVPLSRQAIELLQALSMEGDLVFPAAKEKPLSDMTLTAVLRRMGVDATVHGFRSTFRDWAGERTNYPREVAEHALAHQLPDKTEAAYARGTMMEKRKMMMQEWADFARGTD